MISKQLDSFLYGYNVIFLNKLGFRKGDSPAFLLLPLTDRWPLALDEGKMMAYRSVSLSFC